MIMRKRRPFLLFLAATAASLQADLFTFTGRGEPENWADQANWINKDVEQNPGVPGSDDIARIGGGHTLKITSAMTVGYFQNGVDGIARGPAKVIVDGGTLITTSQTTEYNSASYNCPSSFIVQNGGSATFRFTLLLGRQGVGGGTMIIRDGTVRVEGSYMQCDGSPQLEQRTIVYEGGLLDVNALKLSAGVMDLAGGILIVRANATYDVDEWVQNGRMIAMGGVAGWTIKATLDPDTGWTTVAAEPLTSQQPLTVGALNPVTPVPFRPVT